MKHIDIESKEAITTESVVPVPLNGNPKRIPWRHTLGLAFASLGAVYGDIGTSPLYVMNSIQLPQAQPTRDDVYGCCSIIFWLFVIVVFFKYTLIVLNLGDNEGEGGQIAIYTKIARHLRFGVRGPGVHAPGSVEPSDLEVLSRANTMLSENGEPKSWRENPKVVRATSLTSLALGFVGCALVMSDGLLTPTTTALTAVGGIQVAVPSLTSTVGVAEAVLVFLFLIQYLGSEKLSFIFAPIMFIWLLCLAGSGIYNIAVYDPSVFKSLSPYYAIQLLKKVGIDAFGGGMLAITGAEAMFADLGHFGRLPIQIGISFTMICLMLTYLGQGAYLVKHPDQIANVFYESLPGGVGNGFYWFMFVLAILCTVVASQALILGVFSILQQLINLDCFPKLEVKRISKTQRGKVFIPLANILLFAGVWACTGAFSSSQSVTNAYGLGISLDFIVTSSMLSLCMIFVQKWNPLVAVAYVCIFTPLEFCLVIANCKKVPHGAWFPLAMCFVFTSFFTFWWYFRCKTVEKQVKSRIRLSSLFPEIRGRSSADDDGEELIPMSVSIEDTPVQGMIIPLSKSCTPKVVIIYSDTQSQDMSSPNTFPGVYANLIRNFCSLPPVTIFCTLKSSNAPFVEDEEKVLVVPTRIKGHYKAVIRFGYTEQIKVTSALLDSMQSQLSRNEGNIDLQNRKAVHIFEKNVVRSVSRPTTRNLFILCGHFIRKCLIENLFNPINSVYQNDDRVVLENDEKDAKLFVGSILRI